MFQGCGLCQCDRLPGKSGLVTRHDHSLHGKGALSVQRMRRARRERGRDLFVGRHLAAAGIRYSDVQRSPGPAMRGQFRMREPALPVENRRVRARRAIGDKPVRL